MAELQTPRRKWLSRLFIAPERGEAEPWAQALNVWLALGLFGAVVVVSLAGLMSTRGWQAVWQYRVALGKAWLTTVELSLVALLLSVLLGLGLALIRRSRFLPLRYLGQVYVDLVRSTPLLVQILVLFYGVFDRIHLEDRYVAGVLILSGFSGAYISEIIRSGIESIARSQLDSARAVGFTRSQTYRYVIFPQAFRQILPPLAGEFGSLIKNSSLLSIIGLNEFTNAAQQANSSMFNALETYLPLAAGYLVLALPISLWTRSLEARHRFET